MNKEKVMNRSLTQHAKENLREIHALSREYNGKSKKHAAKLLKMVQEHAEEIAGLYRKKDPHFTTEVGDLIILCHELLLEKSKDPDKVMDLCYSRFKKKLSGLISERNNARRKTQDAITTWPDNT